MAEQERETEASDTDLSDLRDQPGVNTCLVWITDIEQPFIIQAPSREAVIEVVRVLHDFHDVDWQERTPTLISPRFGPAALNYYDVYYRGKNRESKET